MNKFDLTLAESELKLVLEALIDMESKMSNVCDRSNDEDEIADVGNDLIDLGVLLKRLMVKSTEKYGKAITNFSRDLL